MAEQDHSSPSLIRQINILGIDVGGVAQRSLASNLRLQTTFDQPFQWLQCRCRKLPVKYLYSNIHRVTETTNKAVVFKRQCIPFGEFTTRRNASLEPVQLASDHWSPCAWWTPTVVMLVRRRRHSPERLWPRSSRLRIHWGSTSPIRSRHALGTIPLYLKMHLDSKDGPTIRSFLLSVTSPNLNHRCGGTTGYRVLGETATSRLPEFTVPMRRRGNTTASIRPCSEYSANDCR